MTGSTPKTAPSPKTDSEWQEQRKRALRSFATMQHIDDDCVLVSFTAEAWEALILAHPKPLPAGLAHRDINVYLNDCRKRGQTERLHTSRWFAKRWGWAPADAKSLFFCLNMGLITVGAK